MVELRPRTGCRPNDAWVWGGQERLLKTSYRPADTWVWEKGVCGRRRVWRRPMRCRGMGENSARRRNQVNRMWPAGTFQCRSWRCSPLALCL